MSKLSESLDFYLKVGPVQMVLDRAYVPIPADDLRAAVRAVNAHEGLVAALERLVAKYGKYDDGTDKDWTEYVEARAALSAAKE